MIIRSSRIKNDFSLTADPNSKHWQGIEGIVTEQGRWSEAISNHRTELRTIHTDSNLYLLFICNYEELYLKPDPDREHETDVLWDWDVAEAFIGSDFDKITRYKEFQVSPQGEWVDLEIDRSTSPHSHDVEWNSGFEVNACIDHEKKTWYGEMRIPIKSLTDQAIKPGMTFRFNFYRIQGPPDKKKFIAWRPVNNETYHTPEAFGKLVLF